MLEGVRLDLGTCATLAAVYLIEGVRRVPEGATVMRRVLWSEWQVEHEAVQHARWLLASWVPPLTMSLVIPAWDGKLLKRNDRVAEPVVRWKRVLLTISCSAIAALLLVGLPAAASSRGSLGFLVALGVLGALCGAQALIVARWIRAVQPQHSLMRTMLPMLSPFRAPRALEMLREAQLQALGPMRVARVLMSQTGFEKRIRTLAFDRVSHGTKHAELDAFLTTADAARIIKTAPEHEGPYCARCAATYVHGTTQCVNCSITLAVATSRAAEAPNTAAPSKSKSQ